MKWDVLPVGTLLIPSVGSGLARHPGSSALYEAFRCPECAALVMRNHLQVHTDWHERRGEA
jgi:hypothetical protein